MNRIGYLIPEFPGQTHAFFMREREELRRRDVEAVLYSTRPPANGAARHDWAESARKQTTYLTPVGIRKLLAALLTIVACGPIAWFRCLKIIATADCGSFKERLRIAAMVPVAATLVRMANRSGWTHLHIHSCANAAWVGVFLQQLSGLTYSLTLHGPLHDYGSNQHLKWRFAHFVIVITRELIESAQQSLPDDCLSRILLAPMGVEPSRFVRSRPYMPATKDGVVRLVSCGRINPCKGHDDLIRAVHRLRQRGVAAELTICGATDGRRLDYLDQLHSLIQEFHLEQCVQLTGSVSEDRVRQELERAHFFCLASHKEPLGVATMEAMAMELPVIVTESPGVAEMVTSGVNGVLVPACSPDLMADAVLDLLRHPDDCSRMAVNGRLTIEQRFHSGVSAEAIINGIGLPRETRVSHESPASRQASAATAVGVLTK